ncbi:MAG: hypothetical protein NC349_03630 [Paenibacillus sp.]|nr:hypothetical protein [Paenibacillus sp.]
MKRLILLLMAIAIASVNVLFAENPSDVPVTDRFKKLSFPPEKEKRILDVARKVCDEIAPAYRVDTLVPVIMEFPIQENHPILNKKAVSVYYMRNADDYMEYGTSEYNKAKGIFEGYKRFRTPRYVMMVVLTEEDCEPKFIINDNNRNIGVSFQPSYAEFRKANPDYKLELPAPPVVREGEILVY